MRGFSTCSGLARGIDAAAHKASLATGTIGTLAGGHAKPYPREHIALIDEICEQGAVISEMPSIGSHAHVIFRAATVLSLAFRAGFLWWKLQSVRAH